MLFEEGLDNAFTRHRLLAEAVRRAVAVWAEGQVLGFNIAEPAERSNTVTTVTMSGDHDPPTLRDYCKEKCGVVIGAGIGDLQGKAFRIAHMGHVNAPMILGTARRHRGRPQRAEDSPWLGRNRSRDRLARRKCNAVSLPPAGVLMLYSRTRAINARRPGGLRGVG